MHKRKIKLNSIKSKLIISMISLCIIPLIGIGIGAYSESKIILSDKLETASIRFKKWSFIRNRFKWSKHKQCLSIFEYNLRG